MNNKYIRKFQSIDSPQKFNGDVYTVLKAFDVACPATAHAIKKLLCAGLRGSKTRHDDLSEAVQAIQRAMEIEQQCVNDNMPF